LVFKGKVAKGGVKIFRLKFGGFTKVLNSFKGTPTGGLELWQKKELRYWRL